MKFPNLFTKGRKTMTNDQSQAQAATPTPTPAAAPAEKTQAAPAIKPLSQKLVDSYRAQLQAIETDLASLIHRIDGTAHDAENLLHEGLDDAKQALHSLVASVEGHLDAAAPPPEKKA